MAKRGCWGGQNRWFGQLPNWPLGWPNHPYGKENVRPLRVATRWFDYSKPVIGSGQTTLWPTFFLLFLFIFIIWTIPLKWTVHIRLLIPSFHLNGERPSRVELKNMEKKMPLWLNRTRMIAGPLHEPCLLMNNKILSIWY
jgi:hypothetical protein